MQRYAEQKKPDLNNDVLYDSFRLNQEQAIYSDRK